MINIKKYLKFGFIFSFFVMCFLFNTSNIHASESTDTTDTTTDTTDTTTDTTDTSNEDEDMFWDKFDAGLFYAPIQNLFYYRSGGSFSFSGSNKMIAYKSNPLDKWNVYTIGNQVYQDYNDVIHAYAVHMDSYYFDNNHKLIRRFKGLEIGGGSPDCFGNVILSNGYIGMSEARDFSLAQASLNNESFLESNNLTNTFQLDTWDVNGHFNPFTDCRLTQDTATYITISDDGTFNIPLGVSGAYFDYLYSDETYTQFSWWRCYINGIHGEYTLDELEQEFSHYRKDWDAICIIGVGTYNVETGLNQVVGKSFVQAPNLEGYNVVSWNYNILSLNEYNTISAFKNSNFKNNYRGSFEITASTTPEEIPNPDTKPKPDITFSIEDYVKNTDFGFGYISNYITSIGTNILTFNAMIVTVLAWLPEPILSLLCVALMTFVSILFIKLILHLL